MRSWLGLLMIAALPALGQERESPLAFTERVVQAINTKSFEERRALAHPASLPCLDGEARDLFEEVFRRDFTPPVPAGYKTQVRDLTGVPDEQLPRARIEAHGVYPVRPSHIVVVSVVVHVPELPSPGRRAREGRALRASGCARGWLRTLDAAISVAH